MSMRNIAILGSTGSIGTQTLEVVRGNEDMNVVSLAAGSNIDLVEQQIREFHPEVVCVYDEQKARELALRVKEENVSIVYGMDGLITCATVSSADVVVAAVVGMIGIRPVIEAIKAGKHVFCEKPIDHDVDKIKEVIKTLEGTGLKYQVGFNRRFDHNFEAVQKAVADGKIGDTHIIKITSRDPEPPCADYVKVSGGIFLDMTIHDFDMVRFLAGCDATEVYVQGANLVDPAIGEAGDVDTAVITLQMENGAIAVIDNCRKAVYGYDQRAEVFGSEGMVSMKNDSQSSAVISNADGVTGEKPLFFFLERYMDAYGKEIAAFIDAIENDKETPLNVMDGLKPVLMGLAAKKSLEEHRPVKISEIM